MSMNRASVTARRARRARRDPWGRTSLAIIIGLTLAVLAGAYPYYRQETAEVRGREFQALAAVGGLKSGQVLRWRKERLFNAERVAASPQIRQLLADVLRDPGNPGSLAALRDRLQLELTGDQYREVLMFTPDGRVLTSVASAPGSSSAPVDAATQQAIAAALAGREAVLSDLYRGPDGVVQIDVAIAERDTAGPPMAVAVLRSDAADYLFPLIQSWPTPSRSAETLLVQRAGDDVVYLNVPRHRPGSALSQRMPMSRADSPAVQAALGRRGSFEGQSYSGAAVLADLEVVPGSPWFIVAQIDADEALAEQYYRAGEIVIIAGLFLLLAVTAIVSRQRQVKLIGSLVESEREQREVQEAGHIGSYIFDIPSDIWTSSAVLDGIFGIDAAYPRTSEGWAALVHPFDRDEMRAYMRGVIGEHRRFDREYRIVRADDGEERWVLGLGDVEYGADGAPQRMVGAIQDITERRLAQAAKRESDARYRDMFDANPHVMWVFDAETLSFLAVNDAAVAHYGYSREEFLSMTVADIRPPGDLPHLQDSIARAEKTKGIDHIWARHRKRDGTLIDVEITSHPAELGGRRARVVTVYDVTERKQAEAVKTHLEAQLRQSQKMEAIGRLAGGIAHDFNNLLTIIMNTADFASADLKQDDPLRADLEEIHSAGQRAAALTGQLLAFSRKQVLKGDIVQLNTLIANLQPMLARVLGEDLALVVDADKDLGCVRADAGQLEQVIMNFAVNARDAMPEGGTLTFETRNVVLDDADVARNSLMRPGPHVRLTVRDTGVGMDEATRAHVFEPFFTTKERGKGTGLGLSTVYGIVEQTGGSIDVTSEPGRGTTFTICLPRADAAAPAVASAPSPAAASGHETILIVEDEPAVLRTGARILESAGYAVLTATNGLEALRILAGHEGPVHLMLTDVVMPRMGGRELADRVAGIRPEIAIVFTSGYTDDTVLLSDLRDRATRFVGKPYRATELTRTIREALDAPHGHASA